MMAPMTEPLTERRVALVIGNSAYTAVPPLANPQRDAKGVSAALKRLGFEVVDHWKIADGAGPDLWTMQRTPRPARDG